MVNNVILRTSGGISMEIDSLLATSGVSTLKYEDENNIKAYWLDR